MKKKISILPGLFCLSQFAYAQTPAELTSPEDVRQLEALQALHTDTLMRELQAAHNGKIPRASSIYNADKFKIEGLYGKWQVTYKLNNVQSDSIEIDSTILDKDRGYYGWDTKHAISCFYEPG